MLLSVGGGAVQDDIIFSQPCTGIEQIDEKRAEKLPIREKENQGEKKILLIVIDVTEFEAPNTDFPLKRDGQRKWL